MTKNKNKKQFTGVYQKSDDWYLGWIEEVPGVNTQGRTLKEVKENLKEALLLVLETNRTLMTTRGKGKIIREEVSVILS